MTTTQVTITKYIACDDQEFISRSECEDHEREVRKLVEEEVYELLCEKRKLRYAINEARIKAMLKKLDAEQLKQEARSANVKSEYCKLMSEYYGFIHVYKIKQRELFEARRSMRIIADKMYMWFGLRKKQSSIARSERNMRSALWRKEHTPDKCTTSNKIRVNKPQKEEQ